MMFTQEKREWNGYSFRKTIPSLTSLPTRENYEKITSKMEETFFLFSVNGFPKGGERYFFQNFLTLFLFFFTKKFIFLQKQ